MNRRIIHITLQMIKYTDGKKNNVPPGLLQYCVKDKDIIDIDMTKFLDNYNRYNPNFYITSHSNENLLRLTPNTLTARKNKWKRKKKWNGR